MSAITESRLEALPRKTVVRFALDCAERVLPIFERAFPGDDSPRAALRKTRGWLDGEASVLSSSRGSAFLVGPYRVYTAATAAALAVADAVRAAHEDAYAVCAINAARFARDAAQLSGLPDERAWQEDRLAEILGQK